MTGKDVRPAKLLRLGGRAEFLPEPFGKQRVRPGEGRHLFILSRTAEFRKFFASCMHKDWHWRYATSGGRLRNWAPFVESKMPLRSLVQICRPRGGYLCSATRNYRR